MFRTLCGRSVTKVGGCENKRYLVERGPADLPQDTDLDDGADDGVHACAVAARREDCYFHAG